MQPSLQTAVLLLLAGIFLLALELFIPSAGMLFVLAMVCVIGSIVTAFLIDSTYGAGFVVVVFILAMILPGIGFQIWKRSPIGRRMFLETPRTDDEEESDKAVLLGQVGRTITPLRPVGTSEFHGQRIDTVAEGVMIERGEYVRVVHVEGNRVVVRRLAPEEVELSLLDPEDERDEDEERRRFGRA